MRLAQRAVHRPESIQPVSESHSHTASVGIRILSSLRPMMIRPVRRRDLDLHQAFGTRTAEACALL